MKNEASLAKKISTKLREKIEFSIYFSHCTEHLEASPVGNINKVIKIGGENLI
jgi:hypothetical protein